MAYELKDPNETKENEAEEEEEPEIPLATLREVILKRRDMDDQKLLQMFCGFDAVETTK